MKGVLVVAHGSRAKETEATLEKVLEMARKKLENFPLEYAFMEFSEKTVKLAVDRLVEQGVSEIKVVPYFLFSGIHIKEDIPEMVKECVADKPHIKVIMGETLGADPRMADILAERING